MDNPDIDQRVYQKSVQWGIAERRDLARVWYERCFKDTAFSTAIIFPMKITRYRLYYRGLQHCLYEQDAGVS